MKFDIAMLYEDEDGNLYRIKSHWDLIYENIQFYCRIITNCKTDSINTGKSMPEILEKEFEDFIEYKFSTNPHLWIIFSNKYVELDVIIDNETPLFLRGICNQNRFWLTNGALSYPIEFDKPDIIYPNLKYRFREKFSINEILCRGFDNETVFCNAV